MLLMWQVCTESPGKVAVDPSRGQKDLQLMGNLQRRKMRPWFLCGKLWFKFQLGV